MSIWRDLPVATVDIKELMSVELNDKHRDRSVNFDLYDDKAISNRDLS